MLEENLIRKEENKSESKTFNCGICYDDYDPNGEDGNIKFLEKCGHEFCGECFTVYY